MTPSLPLAGPALTAEEFARRLLRARADMRTRGLAALLVVSPENIYYLLGLNHLGYFAFTLLVLPLEGRPLLVTRAMEQPTIEAQVPGCEHVVFADDEDPATAAVRAVRAVTASGDVVGIERTSMFLPVAIWDRVHAALADLTWTDGSGLVEGLRATASPAEIALVRQAAAISDRAVQAGITATRSGVSERDVAAAVYHELVLAGSEQPGLPPLIRSRDVLLREHVTWSDRRLGAGDALFFELSGSVARYHAPLSRMVYLGHAPQSTAAAAEIALTGLAEVCDKLRPGARSADVYAAWQRVVDEGLGHSRYRRHHCGYLVGIGFPPSWVGGGAVVGLRRGGNLVIREGMVFHVLSWILNQILDKTPDQQPSDYVVSDTVLVTPLGGELLTTTRRDPTVVS